MAIAPPSYARDYKDMIQDEMRISTGVVQVLIVSDNPSLTGVLSALLERRVKLRYAGAVRTVDEALLHVEADSTDVVIACAPPSNGRDVLAWRSVHDRGARILMLTTYIARGHDLLAVLSGASALVLIPEHRLIDVIESVGAGEAFLSTDLRERVEAPTSGGPSRELDDEEIEMLAMLSRGSTDSEIALKLGLSHDAVQAGILRLIERLT